MPRVIVHVLPIGPCPSVALTALTPSSSILITPPTISRIAVFSRRQPLPRGLTGGCNALTILLRPLWPAQRMLQRAPPMRPTVLLEETPIAMLSLLLPSAARSRLCSAALWRRKFFIVLDLTLLSFFCTLWRLFSNFYGYSMLVLLLFHAHLVVYF